jgi:hypothetical protein
VSVVNTPADPVDNFIAYIKRLYDLALAYGVGDPNQRVLEFLRHEDYNNTKWQALIGGVNGGFVDYVKAAGVSMIRELMDPFYGIPIGVAHIGATCNVVYLRGKPTGVMLTDIGDVAGWGGDLMTFYGEWRRDSGSYADGYTYCQQKLAQSVGTFKLEDLIDDADGYNIAIQIRQGATVVEAMEANYRAQYLRRMSAYFGGRFDSDVTRAKDLAKDMLLTAADPLISAGRTYLIQSTAGTMVAMPEALPPATLDRFCQGFADKLDELAQLEAPGIAAARQMF